MSGLLISNTFDPSYRKPDIYRAQITDVTTYTDVVNISGSGVLHHFGQSGPLSKDAYLKIVLDGTTLIDDLTFDTANAALMTPVSGINLRFNSSLLIQHKLSATGSAKITTWAVISLD